VQIPDINILVYAHREECQEYAAYHQWFSELVTSGRPFGLTPLVAVGFVRVVTQPKFPGGPTPVSQALACMDLLREQPGCAWLSPGPRHWEIVSSFCRQTSAVGKAIADAQHAAVALEHQGIWCTRDTDFMRFKPHGLNLNLLNLTRT